MVEPWPKRLLARALGPRTVTYSRADVMATALVAAVVALWAAVAGGSFSLLALVACEAVFFAFYVTGSLFASVARLSVGVSFDLPLRLLVGYGVVNSALLLLAVLSPLGMIANFCVVLALAFFVFFSAKERKASAAEPASLWLVGICVAATTLWCQDSIAPISEQGNNVLFKPWVDGFYHAVHIRTFAYSHGASTIEDFRMAGVPARLYHYGVYMMPAFIERVSGIASYTAFAGILAPVGVLFTGLAAYAFFASLWGPWPGVAAAMALLLLPDGAQQGAHNLFMSYHWLTQISPSASYGLALLAVAWLFVVRGCTQGNTRQLLLGWFVACLLVAYKLHYVIASALLLLLVPALFFRGRLGLRRRALWVGAACAFYVVSLVIGQHVPGVPLIRFDGSSAGEIMRLVRSFAMPGPLESLVGQRTGANASFASNVLFGVPYVVLTTLGLFAPLLLGLAIVVWRRTTPLYVLFPLLLLANFLTMFFGLALDMGSSTPDELSHRPLMIVYFFVAAWVGAAAGLVLIESRRLARFAPQALVGLAAVLMIVPATFGPGVQRMWAMPRISPVRLPVALVRVADYIREHGSADEVFQDSVFDQGYAISALSERRSFVSHTMTTMPYRGDQVAKRTAAVDRLMGLRQAKLIVGTARAYGIRWFVLHRGNKVNWPPELADHPVFRAGPIALYEF